MNKSNTAADDGVLFECHTCREEPCMPRLDDLSAWARLCGYDSTCVRLCRKLEKHEADGSDAGSGPPAESRLPESWFEKRCGTQAVCPPFLEESPQAGERYIASVTHPFIAKKGEPFWFLFQPPLSLLNGWEDNPEEIFSSKLVHAVLERVLHRAEKFALIVITAQEVVGVPALHEYFPETTDAKVFSMFDDDFARRAAWVRWLNYVYVYWNLESDVGVWWLFRQDQPLAHEPARLVLQGHWGWHDALIWAGNQRLSEAEAAHLHAFMLR